MTEPPRFECESFLQYRSQLTKTLALRVLESSDSVIVCDVLIGPGDQQNFNDLLIGR